MFNYWTPVDKVQQDPRACDSLNTSMDLSEIENNLKKEILDDSYASDCNQDQAPDQVKEAMLLEDDIEIKLGLEIGEQIME